MIAQSGRRRIAVVIVVTGDVARVVVERGGVGQRGRLDPLVGDAEHGKSLRVRVLVLVEQNFLVEALYVYF